MIMKIEPEDLGANFLKMLQAAGGYYRCPIGTTCGNRLGPLVGYKETYEEGGVKKHYVGEVDFNFSYLDKFVLNTLVEILAEVVTHQTPSVVGMPDYIIDAGSEAAILLARHLNCEYVAIEQSEGGLIWGQDNRMGTDSTAIICQDVFGNGSTPEDIARLVTRSGSSIIGLACHVNSFIPTKWHGRPVYSLLRMPIAQYRQDDWLVSLDVEENNVCWDPKIEWPRLVALMK